MARGRIPSVASLQRRATAITTRQTKLAARQKLPPKIGSRGQIPRDSVKYKSSITSDEYTILASESGIKFFGDLAALGLAAPDGSPGKPPGFKPALVRASVGLATPANVTSALSGTKYQRYSAAASKATRNHFSAPLSANTALQQRNLFKTLYAAKKAAIKDYGRMSFVAEALNLSLSG